MRRGEDLPQHATDLGPRQIGEIFPPSRAAPSRLFAPKERRELLMESGKGACRTLEISLMHTVCPITVGRDPPRRQSISKTSL